MGSRMIRDQSGNSKWWLMIGLFTLCVVGWSLAFSFKVGASAPAAEEFGVASEVSGDADRRWNLAEFDRVSISGSHDITLVQGSVSQVSGRGKTRALDGLEISVQGRELMVRNKPGNWFDGFRRGSVELRIEFETLERITVSGSSQVDAGAVQSPRLTVVVSGSGDFEIEALSSDELDLQVSGSADVDIGGTVREQRVKISGSADYDARGLPSETASIRVSGSGDAQLAVSGDLDATVQGSGSVRYVGNPHVRSSVSGSGDIRPLD